MRNAPLASLALTLLLAQAALAAPCSVLPYQNQCQGSNYWPKPAGWGAYSSSTCQPAPPFSVKPNVRYKGGSVERDTIEEVAAAMIAATPSGYVSVFVPGGQTVLGPYNRSALYFSCSSPATFIGFTLGAVYSYRPAACPGGLIGYSFTPDRTILADVMRCPTNTVLYNGTATDDASVFKQTSEGTSFGLRSRWYTCLVAGVINKPADGVCTTRWADASITALQKDPLDPDCGAGTCMLDGRCALK